MKTFAPMIRLELTSLADELDLVVPARWVEEVPRNSDALPRDRDFTGSAYRTSPRQLAYSQRKAEAKRAAKAIA